MDLTVLTKYADDADQMQPSALLGDQCLKFAEYIERTGWHHSVRPEAKELAKRFRKTYRFCVEWPSRTTNSTT